MSFLSRDKCFGQCVAIRLALATKGPSAICNSHALTCRAPLDCIPSKINASRPYELERVIIRVEQVTEYVKRVKLLGCVKTVCKINVLNFQRTAMSPEHSSVLVIAH